MIAISLVIVFGQSVGRVWFCFVFRYIVAENSCMQQPKNRMTPVRMNQNTEATGKHQNKELKHFEMLFSAEWSRVI